MKLNEQCLEYARKSNDGLGMYALLSDKAAIMLKQIKVGERDKADISLAKKYLRQSYILTVAKEDEKSAQLMERVYKKEFGENMQK